MHIDLIREACRRGPFIPFLLRMNDGRIFSVPHNDYVAVGKRHVVFIDPATDASIFLEPGSITSLEYAVTTHSAPDNGTGGNT